MPSVKSDPSPCKQTVKEAWQRRLGCGNTAFAMAGTSDRLTPAPGDKTETREDVWRPLGAVGNLSSISFAPC